MSTKNKFSSTAEHLRTAIVHSGKTLRQICDEVGLARPNILTMMQNGTCKVPLARIPALAKACGVAPVPFLRIALQEYHPEVWSVIGKVLGGLLSDDEIEWLSILRTAQKAQPITIDSDLWLAVYTSLMAEVSKRSF
jgi:hypothetical protein